MLAAAGRRWAGSTAPLRLSMHMQALWARAGRSLACSRGLAAGGILPGGAAPQAAVYAPSCASAAFSAAELLLSLPDACLENWNDATAQLAGAMWIAALLATLLGLQRLFAADYADGTLEQMALSPEPLSILIAGKITAHWLVCGLPLVLLAPVIASAISRPVLGPQVSPMWPCPKPYQTLAVVFDGPITGSESGVPGRRPIQRVVAASGSFSPGSTDLKFVHSASARA